MARVTLENVEKTYKGGVRAVNGISLEIADEEFVVLVGPSGCGKSTTLRMVAGLEEISAGYIRIGDRVVNDVPPKDRDIAMVFQNYALYPHMTVYKNLAFALKLRKIPKNEIQQRVQWATELLGLEGLLDRRPKALSGGQRQRVAVGRVRHPQLFLFDEPLSNLDAKLRVTTRAELKRLQQQLSTTTIYVTHDQEEAMTLGDRVVVMNDGVIHQCDTPLEVYRHPVDRFVAGFVGMPPMNFVDGRLAKQSSRRQFEGGGLSIELTPRHSQALVKQAGDSVVLGIRPESLSVSDEGVDVVETLGAQMNLFVRTKEDQLLVCRTETDAVQPGSRLKLRVDHDAIHLFEVNRKAADGAVIFGKNLTLSVT